METDPAVVMSGSGGDDYVELADYNGVTPKGRLFRKQILHFGEFVHPKLPGQKVVVDENFADTMIKNFNDKVCDIVQVPVVDDQNRHTEDPLRNSGAVVALEKVPGKGVFAVMDARKEEVADQLGKTLIGASAMFHPNYVDTKTGAKRGPTLLHMAITNRPYITDLSDFEEVIAASADTYDEAVLLGADEATEEEMPKTKEELIAALKEEHGIDVEQLLAAQPSVPAELSNALGTDEELTLQDVANAVVELSSANDTLRTRVEELEGQNDTLVAEATEKEIDDLIKAGRILPAKKDAMIKLARKDREMFESLLPDQSIVSLSEDGVTTHQSTQAEEADKERERLINLANGRDEK